MQNLINQQLINAVKSGNIVDVKHIIEQRGAEMTALDEDGYSVLHLAVYRGMTINGTKSYAKEISLSGIAIYL